MASSDQRSPFALRSEEKTESESVDLNEKAASSSDGGMFADFKDTGDLGIEDYREMMDEDPQVKAAIMLKILARISSGYDIEPASEDPIDIEAAEFIQAQFDNMRGTMTGFLRKVMLAMAYGQTVHEIVLCMIESGDWAGKIGLDSLKWKRPEQFEAKTDKFGNLEHIEQSQEGTFEKKKLDPKYFVYWVWDDEGDYVGKSDLRPAYRYFKAKRTIDGYWNVYLDKFAAPTPVAKYANGADVKQQAAVLGFLKNLHTSKALVLPKLWDVELMEAQRSGGSGGPGYETKIKYCDRMIARAILLPTLLLDEGEKGAYALGQQHADNFMWVLDALGDEVAEEVIEEQLIKFLIGINFATDKFPKFKWRPYTQADMEKLSKAFALLIDKGIITPDEEFLRDKMDLPPRETPLPGPSSDPGGSATPTEDDSGAGQTQLSAAIELSAAGKKFKATEVRNRMDSMQEDAVEVMESTVRSILIDIKKQVRDKKILENKDHAAVQKITAKNMGQFRKALEFALAESVMWGASDGSDELKRGAERSGAEFPITWPETMGSNLSIGDGSQEPVEFVTTRQQVIAAWEGKVPIQRTALAEYGREAHTITGVFKDDILDGSKRIIDKGIRRGSSYAQVSSELTEFFEPYMADAGALDAGLANAWRIENIVRTNMSEAYNTGRMNLFMDPAVGDFIVAFEYSAVMDNRTTPFCDSWDGTVMKKDDPRVDSINPPNHHQCRSVLIPITRGELYELSELPAVEPAKGFMFGACCA